MTSTNGGNAVIESGITGTFGVFHFHTGTSNTTGGGGFNFNYGGATSPCLLTSSQTYTLEFYIYFSVVSDGTNTYILRVGFGGGGSTAPTEGCTAEYTHSVNGGALTLKTIKTSGGAANTVVNGTGPALAINTLYRITLVASNSSCTLYQDGVSIATVSSNFPTVAVSFGGSMIKSAGLTQRDAYCDYVYYKQAM